HLYPDVLNLYGDRGNIICMQKRLQWRGIDVVTSGVSVGQTLCADDFDLIMIGGGQEFFRKELLDDLHEKKTPALKSAMEDGKTVLGICNGYQLLGHSYETADGTKYAFAGVIDVHTVAAKKRMTGDYTFSCDELGGEVVVGFENHIGKTYLAGDVRPLGHVVKGFGNNGEDGTEGARYKNIFASYGHGSLLPKNPALCDLILKTTLERKYGAVDLPPLDDALEQRAHDFMIGRIG
ncbi:MAG: glutamine amidotransferase, partial [Oscillospiraceae bacterium]|nr:glutamine amidotransferase [Oscillospiraceae bacterium]